MNIRQISFGKTVKLNMPEMEACKLAATINSNRPVAGENNRIFQKDAKAIFDDTAEGDAFVCSPDNGKHFYILSGKESTKLQEIRNRVNTLLETMAEFYKHEDFFEQNVRYIRGREKEEVYNLINSTKENYVLSLCYDEEQNKRLSKFKIVV